MLLKTAPAKKNTGLNATTQRRVWHMSLETQEQTSTGLAPELQTPRQGLVHTQVEGGWVQQCTVLAKMHCWLLA